MKKCKKKWNFRAWKKTIEIRILKNQRLIRQINFEWLYKRVILNECKNDLEYNYKEYLIFLFEKIY